jgi:hypothetical protein
MLTTLLRVLWPGHIVKLTYNVVESAAVPLAHLNVLIEMWGFPCRHSLV